MQYFDPAFWPEKQVETWLDIFVKTHSVLFSTWVLQYTLSTLFLLMKVKKNILYSFLRSA